jgi:DNA mismatch endonuclease (patch repair protein)
MFSTSKRSDIMSRIRSKNTGLERSVAELLSSARVKYEMHPKITGNPDFLIGSGTVLFCDSSFWHGRDWNNLRKRLMRGNNPAYWVNHISKNRRRDRKVTKELTNLGFTVIRLWDRDVLRSRKKCIEKIREALDAQASRCR